MLKTKSEIFNKLSFFNKINTDSTPDTPGIYFFADNKKKIIYIGKSKSLKARLKSYTLKSIWGKTKIMINSTKYFGYINLNSEFESLIYESKLITLFKPKYNILLKDDKSPAYILIVNQQYPIIKVVREKYIEKYPDENYHKKYGPFLSKKTADYITKTARKIFPFSTHKTGKKPCLYSQMGLCKPCPNYIESVKDKNKKSKLKNTYIKNINYLISLLDGNLTGLISTLEKDMKQASKQTDYEKSNQIYSQIKKLQYLIAPKTDIKTLLENPQLSVDIRRKELNLLKKLLIERYPSLKDLKNIECYDVAHIQGSFPTASMVCFINGMADKTKYKRFKIRQSKGSSDYDSLLEVAERRFKHLKDWGVPDLIVVDGGKAQVSAFLNYFEKTNIALVGLVKPDLSLIIPLKNKNKPLFKKITIKDSVVKNFLKRLDDEAHRFSRSYHRKLVNKYLFSKNKIEII